MQATIVGWERTSDTWSCLLSVGIPMPLIDIKRAERAMRRPWMRRLEASVARRNGTNRLESCAVMKAPTRKLAMDTSVVSQAYGCPAGREAVESARMTVFPVQIVSD